MPRKRKHVIDRIHSLYIQFISNPGFDLKAVKLHCSQTIWLAQDIKGASPACLAQHPDYELLLLLTGFRCVSGQTSAILQSPIHAYAPALIPYAADPGKAHRHVLFHSSADQPWHGSCSAVANLREFHLTHSVPRHTSVSHLPGADNKDYGKNRKRLRKHLS